MNEQELRQKWQTEHHMYEAWGKFIVDTISSSLKENGLTPSSFFKIPPKPRVKDAASLADKAFRRKKNYDDPYDDIEDKVGVRFVVLLTSDINPIDDVIRSNRSWVHDMCRHYQTERDAEPMLFAYQSVHHIVRANADIQWAGIKIKEGTPCEVQIRTLLQHAHSELTHDSIYKARTLVKPAVHRAVAKSMALIEATDDYFIKATTDINNTPVAKFNIIPKLDALYEEYTDHQPLTHKSALIVWDEFEDFVDENLVETIRDFFSDGGRGAGINFSINKKYNSSGIYQQSVVLFLYWLVAVKRSQTFERWPLYHEDFTTLATDLGISTTSL
jgi:ppGpp synthetase/RelA/SpoT-type nucleotidyltranferase